MTRRDDLIAKLADVMDPQNARQFVDDVLAEAQGQTSTGVFREMRDANASGDLGPRPVVEEWVRSDLFCQKCGTRDTWQRAGEVGDYYHENSVACKACGHVMCCVDQMERATEQP